MRVTSRFVQKVWGEEEWLINTSLYCGKVLYLNPGWQCSLHYHREKDETFHILAGEVMLEVWTGGQVEFIHMKYMDTYNLPPQTPHRFWSISGPAEILEISTTHSDDDVVRVEDSCRRDPHGS
jgi:mannose-6-phosphate isomerase-like protein (cupin superfamily)